MLVTASVEDRLPPWLRGKGEGWVTAEYGMLPRATHTRGRREAAKGKQSGRTQEIQRLIGRSLRAVMDLKGLGERQIRLDCDVIQADGGTRTTAISGAWVALRLAIDGIMTKNALTRDPLTHRSPPSAAASTRDAVLDLDYVEDWRRRPTPISCSTRAARSSRYRRPPRARPMTRKACSACCASRASVARNLRRAAEGRRAVMARRLARGRLVLATHNAGKVREIAALMTPFGMDVVAAGDLGLPEPAETEDSFRGNALIKAHASAQGSGLPALADDSGLCVAALGGAPGVYTADWAETPTGRDWNLAMRKVEDLLAAQGPDVSRAAEFVCALALAWPDGHAEVFEGRVAGHLTWPPRGDLGFGYDPVFVADGMDRTFAEIDPHVKHSVSHRAAAFAKLVAACLGDPR